MKKTIFKSVIKTGVKLSISLAVILVTTSQLLAQPPSFPSNPSQSPIDGGLLLLALLGGGYAWKKLRDTKSKSDN